MRHKLPAVPSPISRLSVLASCRNILWKRFWRPQGSDRLLGFFQFLSGAALHQRFEFSIKADAAVLRQFDEAEG